MNPRLIASLITAWLLFFPITARAALGATCVVDAGCDQKAGEYCRTEVISRSNVECTIEEARRCIELLGNPQATCLDNACVIIAGTCAPILSQTSSGLAGTGEKISAQKPELQVDIPALDRFADVEVAQDAEGKSYALFPWIGQYIKAVYLYLLGIAGLIAVIMLIHAGFEWMTSGGNTHAIEQAKTRIYNVSIGLVILFGSYTLLNLINPDLIKFKSLQVEIVKGVPIDFDEQIAHRESVEEESGDSGEEALPGVDEGITLPFPDDKGSYKPAVPVPFLKGGDRYINPPRPCVVKLPSIQASYPGVKMNYSLLGKLDCNVSTRTKTEKRDASKVTSVVLHEGFPPGRARDMVRMWFSDYHYGPLVRCEEKNGRFNFESCTKKGQLLHVPPHLKQTPIGSHYAIDADGTVYQLADELHIMNHCCAANTHAIGIDLLVSGKDPAYTGEQYNALAALLKGLSQKYGFGLNDRTIQAHCELGSHADPRNFKWRQLGKILDAPLDPGGHGGASCGAWPEDSGSSGQTDEHVGKNF